MIKVSLSDGTQLASFALDELKGSDRPAEVAPPAAAQPRVRVILPLPPPASPALPQPGLSAAERQELDATLQRARRLHSKYHSLLG